MMSDLFPEAYEELRRLAAHYMRGERAGHTLQTTALAHEVFLKLSGEERRRFKDKTHFLAIASRSMRQILIEHARARKAQKRGGGYERVPLEEAVAALDAPDLDILDLDEALQELARLDERKARIVEMRFFGGMTLDEIAQVLDVSHTTAQEDWYLARAWLGDRFA